MQNIDIEFASGPKAGQRIRLTDRSLVFGRTRVADIVLDWDGLISSKHFRIENQNGCFTLQDLGSTNGTQINGQRVDSKLLASGDKIVVGKTTLVVRAEAILELDVSPAKPNGIFNPFESSVAIADDNVRPSSVPDSSANADSNKKFNPFESGIVLAKNKMQQGDSSVSESVVDSNRKFNPFESHFFKEEDLAKIIQEGGSDRTSNDEGGARLPGDVGIIETACVIAKSSNAARQVFEVTKKGYPSGIWRLRGKRPDDESFVHILDSLHRLGAYYLLIDFSRISIPLPKGLDCSESSLFEWLPSEVMKKSPLLYALEELVDWKLFVDEGLGRDAIIALHSELPKEELLAKLRKRLVSSSHGTEASRGILGFCWPSVLESLLENNSNGFGKSFFDDVKLVVIEVPGKPGQWQLFGQEEALETATKIGLRITKDTSKELEELETSS